MKRKSVFLALAMALGFSGAAIAQDRCAALVSGGACSCAKPLAAGGVVARLSDVVGGVQITGRQGLASASRATPILVGDSVVVPSSGSAVFDFGAGCSPTLANASVVVSAIDSCACARIENADVTATTSRPASLPPHALAQGAIAPPPPAVEAIDDTVDDSAPLDAPPAGGVSPGVLGAGIMATVLGTTILANELGDDDEEPVSE